ncbi:hypothetical protein PPERSA_01083 [Pseudocohnilembus persalinus]|uniref:Tubulin-tyrosine ligase family protein n=1 Tax=Pseudocohnilembus persalinus TaxID=266149 RepID=A0A0V0QVV0_PSEPJ|nr:hypothetical protein PPERSA_01083 [Pseudocohnilembus persalinus]|eukprot:KRX06005.1 hypothetical protein PPERSA_01083 [Pseudocohnilembus persalinus]
MEEKQLQYLEEFDKEIPRSQYCHSAHSSTNYDFQSKENTLPIINSSQKYPLSQKSYSSHNQRSEITSKDGGIYDKKFIDKTLRKEKNQQKQQQIEGIYGPYLKGSKPPIPNQQSTGTKIKIQKTNKQLKKRNFSQNQKENKEFRIKNIQMIHQLQEKQQLIKQQKEQQKQTTEQRLQKIKGENNFNQVESKLHQQTQQQLARIKETEQELLKKKSQISQNKEASKEQEQLQQEQYKRIFQRQMEYLSKIKEKKLELQQQEEEKKQKQLELKQKMEKHVLVNIKQKIQDGEFYVEDSRTAKKNQNSKLWLIQIYQVILNLIINFIIENSEHVFDEEQFRIQKEIMDQKTNFLKNQYSKAKLIKVGDQPDSNSDSEEVQIDYSNTEIQNQPVENFTNNSYKKSPITKPKTVEKSPKKKSLISQNLQKLNLEKNNSNKQNKQNKKQENKNNDSSELDQDQEETEQQGVSENQIENVNQGKSVKRKLRSYPFINDLTEWKKKQRIPQETKIFIVSGGYGDLKKALRAKGWVENPDPNSQCFDFKWTLLNKEINYSALKDFQIVNHFQKVIGITTKVGLCRNLRHLAWCANVDVNEFYPRCYDLTDNDEIEEFETDFKITKAESILKQYANKMKNNKNVSEEEEVVIQVALQVYKRKLRDINELIDEQGEEHFKLITDEEWEILSADELDKEGLIKQKHEKWKKRLDKKLGKTINVKKSKKKKTKQSKKQIYNSEIKEEEGYNDIQEQDFQATEKEEANENDGQYEDEYEEDEQDQEKTLHAQVLETLEEGKKQNKQYNLTEEKNIWILKPASSSRGRGITCYNSLIEIQDHIKAKEFQWVAQKYLENSMIIENRRKFDIRIWVIISDWNPLVIWKYKECYIRLSAQDYSTEDLSNKYQHLCNNSISKKNKDIDDILGSGNMFSQSQFQQYIISLHGKDLFKEKIEPQMKKAIIWSMQGCAQSVEQRKGSFEMFGYDFMVDNQFNVWLLEINSSPDMSYSTDVTTGLVKQSLADIPKIIIDYNQAKKKEKKNVDTGMWKRIFKGASVLEKPQQTVGVNMCVEGIPIKIPGFQQQQNKQNSQVAVVNIGNQFKSPYLQKQ